MSFGDEFELSNAEFEHELAQAEQVHTPLTYTLRLTDTDDKRPGYAWVRRVHESKVYLERDDYPDWDAEPVWSLESGVYIVHDGTGIRDYGLIVRRGIAQTVSIKTAYAWLHPSQADPRKSIP